MIGTSIALAAGIAGAVGAAASAAGGIASAVGAGAKANTQEGMLDAYRKQQPLGYEATGMSQMQAGQAGFQAALSNEVAAGSSGQMDFANMLKSYAEGGNMPNAKDIANSQAFAQSQFDPQRVAQQQAFKEQLTNANRSAALSGRGINDPILRAKLAQEQTRQNAMLTAQQGAFAANFAMQQPGQRLGYMGQRADTLVSRGQTALSNQANLFQMGAAAQQQGFAQRQSQFQTEFNAFSGIKSQGEIIGGAINSVGAAATQFGGIANSFGAQQMNNKAFGMQEQAFNAQQGFNTQYNDALMKNMGAQTNMFNAQAKSFSMPQIQPNTPQEPIGTLQSGGRPARNYYEDPYKPR